jgi:hypothetical protein|tara:strand:- start:257 stop:721 length:465 start_codon:yes stop_codon:yes gene_type:complete
MHGLKHIIECRCILPTLKNKEDPPLHQFVVFSVIDDDDKVCEKYAQCNNCGVVHKVYDLCKSEILASKEELKSALTIEDIKFTLPEAVAGILENYECDLPTYEHVKFMYDFNITGEFTILTKEQDESRVEGKILRYKEGKTFSIEPFTSTVEIK